MVRTRKFYIFKIFSIKYFIMFCFVLFFLPKECQEDACVTRQHVLHFVYDQ